MFQQLEAIIFDFDGVLTDNNVWIDEDGREMVCCSRADGLAFDVLRKLKKQMFILSTETNSVVLRRGEKLNITVCQGIKDKVSSLKKLAIKYKFSLDSTLYIGNDLNDYHAMKVCGYSACPSDSHPKILEVASFRLKACGGHGVEYVFQIDMLETLYSQG